VNDPGWQDYIEEAFVNAETSPGAYGLDREALPLTIRAMTASELKLWILIAVFTEPRPCPSAATLCLD
jgi:hypothetical protein